MSSKDRIDSLNEAQRSLLQAREMTKRVEDSELREALLPSITAQATFISWASNPESMLARKGLLE
ncbi:hypothetical protein [Curtobacterium sp. VKM Ac-1395]|jgi:hypothetical protein|uniref:hypothetical protein n=1 Tax=Curtobacterium sp. VKM Ac-1395 TaxID=2783815 RepID=UPI00188C33D4|nr:hypothetical protein [Curtobacterium sp. VKM Ac-1395]MBF4592121.1 hypothetical protein [Curtobacterium sp. VKM Ac-1395]